MLRFLHRPGSELELALEYLLWAADATGKQVAKTTLPAFFLQPLDLQQPPKSKWVADFCVPVPIFQTGSLCGLPKKTRSDSEGPAWQDTPPLKQTGETKSCH